MFPIITPQMINLPDSLQAASQTRLPWPNGSIVSARLMPSGIPGTALLIIGSYRLLAEVPPTTPMGEVWMQLLNREMPARFRLLSNMQALHLLAGMLEADMPETTQKPSSHTSPPSAHARQSGGYLPEWPHLSNPQRHDGKGALPWHGEAAPDGNSLLWYDTSDEQPRGMLHRHMDNEQFILSGRVDLDKLGSMAFSIQGKINNQDANSAETALNLRLHTAKSSQLGELRHAFADWLQQQHVAFPHLSGDLEYGLPDGGPGDLSERTA
ncbi:MAG: hypothetical protein R8K53_06460 [Mariprofundaceae bacterium]